MHPDDTEADDVPHAAASTFRERFERAADANDSLLCIGLDPPPRAGMFRFLLDVIEVTADLVCCYKINSAFFEASGPTGFGNLRRLIRAVPEHIPTLLDVKRGDVGHTAEQYAHSAFAVLGAHAATVNPYFGRDSVAPFSAYADRHTFVVCRTSNPDAGLFQDMAAGDGLPLYLHVAHAAQSWNGQGNVGLVVAGNAPAQVRRVRDACPDMLLLMPGIGAQGGDIADAVSAGADGSGGGILVSASRSILQPVPGEVSVSSVRESALRARADINAARSALM